MPLKSRATENRAQRAGTDDLDKKVTPRGGGEQAAESPSPQANKSQPSPPEQETPPPAADEAPKVRKPRTATKPKAALSAVPDASGAPVDKKAIRARLKEIETEFKKQATTERQERRELESKFAAQRTALQNEHAKLSLQLSSAAFGK